MRTKPVEIRPRTCNSATLARYLGISRSKLYAAQKDFPFAKISIGSVRVWDLEVIDEYLDSLKEKKRETK